MPISMTMGRRAKTNCSPVDSALEKYHNDIGNRLSGVFLPPHPCPANSNEESSPCDAFNMLTLDFRGKHGIKHTTADVALTTACQKSSTMPMLNRQDNNNHKNVVEESDENDDCHKDDSAFDQIPSASNPTDVRSKTLPTFSTQQNDFSAVSSLKEKRNIMDKFARAIFQRKHTCARCQRRSRSCLQNKTFTLNEKHYTCARCRETSRAFKNLVTGQDNNTTTNSSIDNNDLSKNNADIILRKPRLELKDSGYETVTSCSTVASAHSNSNSPYASANRQNNIDNSNPCGATTATTATSVSPKCLRGVPATPSEVDHEVDELIRKASSKMTVAPYYSSGRRDIPDSSTATNAQLNNKPSYHGHDYVNLNNAGIEQYLGVAEDNGCRVLKQVKTRYVQDYDGYLNLPVPVSTCHRTHNEDTDGYCNCEDSHPNMDTDSKTRQSVNNSNVSKPSPKMCHICETTSRPCFRLPWEGGWLCEECIDGML